MTEFFTRIYDSVFVAQLATVSLSLVIMFLPKKMSLRKYGIGVLNFVLIFAIGTLTQALSFSLFSINRSLTSLSFTVAYLILTCIVFFLTKEEKRPKAIILITFLATTTIITEFGAQLMRTLMDIYQINFDWISIVSYIFIFAYAILVRKISVLKYSNTTAYVEILAFIISITSIILIRTYTIYAMSQDIRVANYFTLFTMFSLYIIVITTYLLIYLLCKERETVIELSAEKVALDSDKEMMRISQQTYADIRTIKHDIKNQYSIMSILLKDGKYDELQKYFDDLGNTLAFSLYRIDCGNEKINAVINMEIAKARSMDIAINTNLIVPKELSFHGSDLCGIIANGIDNAIEYLHHSEVEDKSINVDILPKGDFLYIGISNKVIGIEDTDSPNLNTSKKEKASHGLGHKIINRLAKKYNGYAVFSISNSMFHTEVMIDMKYKKQK